ncbi:unnamed protein product [Brassica rapa subsp. narinosa]
MLLESHSSACPHPKSQTQKLSTLLRRSRLQRSLTTSPTFAPSSLLLLLPSSKTTLSANSTDILLLLLLLSLAAT